VGAGASTRRLTDPTPGSGFRRGDARARR
jgi:hypothetical protein